MQCPDTSYQEAALHFLHGPQVDRRYDMIAAMDQSDWPAFGQT